MNKKYKIIISVLFSAIFLLAFAPPLNPTGGWTQQFLPYIGSSPIADITFVDSIVGYAVTNYQAPNDTDYVLKTTNGGDNWIIIRIDAQQFAGFNSVVFLNRDTGFTCGVSNFPANTSIQKTTNGGQNWMNINPPDASASYYDILVLNNDTIWVVDIDGVTGGVFRTTNGGANWQVQYQGNNPNRIYMYDRDFGFISPPSTGALYRTTNSGENWTQVPGTEGFNDIKFIDNLTGWKTRGQVKKTTDGGLNWVQQTLPSGGIIISSGAGKLSVLSRDTVWATGGYVQYPNLQSRGMIYRTTNGGTNWLFQIPDTTIHVNGQYSYIQFVNSKVGWVYSLITGIHTTTGGDPIWYTGVQQIISEIPKQFKLYQNYPNPFNPRTIIKASLSPSKGGKQNVKLLVYDITGKEIAVLLNGQYSAGTYEVTFDGSDYSSGVYFYSLVVNGKLIDTKRMVLIK